MTSQCIKIAALLALAASCTIAAAQPWPARPVRLIVPYAPGGTTDIVARLLAKGLATDLGAQIVVENRAGASGIIGTQIVAAATPDGYTLALIYTPHTTLPSMGVKLPYDPIKSFAPITQLTTSPLVLVAYPGAPYPSVTKLIAAAKAAPGNLAFANSGSGSAGNLAAVVLADMAGVKILNVPYKGSGAAKTDLLAGRVPLMFDGVVASAGQIKSGQLRALAVTSRARSSAMPDVPTVSESGLPGFEVTAWSGLLAPAGTPADVLLRIRDATNKVLHSPDVKARLDAEGAEPVGSTPTQFAAFLVADIARWNAVVKHSGVTFE
jgi:tripartite-type tricarboxylate transporter receptor subunit TctC